MMKSKKVEFMPPKGFTAPEGSNSVGDSFDMLCTFKMTPSGVCLTKMGDTDMPRYDDKTESKPSYSDYAASMSDASGQQQQMQS